MNNNFWTNACALFSVLVLLLTVSDCGYELVSESGSDCDWAFVSLVKDDSDCTRCSV